MHDFSDGIFRQQGAVLLLLVLVLLTGSTFTLLVKLNSDTNFYIRHNNQTQKSLRLAKQALIGYAINFPEIDRKTPGDAINGPGYLPCPDIKNDGEAGGSCSRSGKTTIGRLPYETLEIAELTDSSGARLWYALSDNFRNNPALEPLNSETVGQLRVDGRADIVAVVIAPGAPVGDQVRDPGETDIETEIGNYLESDNNDLDLDLDFISADPANPAAFNDSLIIITRRELMQIIEKRVLSEVENQFNNYRDASGAFPWLSPFDNPDTSAFKSSTSNSSISEGHIPFHYSGDDADSPDPFEDDIILSWRNLIGMSECLPSTSTATYSVPQIDGIDIPDARCNWTDRNTFDCAGSFDESGKTYDFDITFVDAEPTINARTESSLRTRDLDITITNGIADSGVLNFNDLRITETDTLTSISMFLCNDKDTSGTIIATDILYDLDANGIDGNGDGDFLDAGTDFAPELHGWFIRNEWHKQVYIAYLSSEPPPGDTTASPDCNLPGGCLKLKGTAYENIRAIAVIAGAPLEGHVRPSANISAYFELENQSPGDVWFEKAAFSGRFNDQVRIIKRAPPPPP